MADTPIGQRNCPAETGGRVSSRVGGLSRPLRLGSLGARAASQTALITANTYQVAHGHELGIFMVGCAISWLWWWNAGHAGRSTDPFDGLVYGVGAGVGSLVGYLLTAWLYA